VLLHNAGLDRSVVLAAMAAQGNSCGCDVMTGRVVDMHEAAIYDAASILAEAVRRAVTGAALLLTTDTLIHHAQPETVMTPR
jgi:chaperonin GroEL (HSP60 family)